MKIIPMKKIVISILSLCMLFVFTSCNDDDNVQTQPTIAQLAATTSSLSTLTQALEIAGLTSALNNPNGDNTVFAPTNEAFDELLVALGVDSIEDIPVATLEKVLLNHVITGTSTASSLSTGYVPTLALEATTDNPIDVYVEVGSGVELNGISTVTSADIAASNGVVHIVDKVITLPTVVTFALADDRFSTLVSALTRPAFNNAFVTTLTGDGPFTVFAPTNDAFAALLTELGLDSLDDVSDANLESILNYHVVSGANVLSSTLTDGQSIATISGDSFTIDLDNGAQIIDANNRVTDIIITDVQANNGVIHAINKVLLN